MQAVSPAPRSTATLAPSAMNFLTVSGVAATRVSPAARSCRTAMRIAAAGPVPGSSGNQEHDEQGDQGDHRQRPFEQVDEPAVGLLVCLQVIAGLRHAEAPIVSSLTSCSIRPEAAAQALLSLPRPLASTA